MMPPRTWLLTTIGLLLTVGGGLIALNTSLDIYGIFHNPRGRRLAVFGDERVAKYLLSGRYVPENFDAVLIGSSVSANWNTSQIRGLRVYNESIYGGNINEEKSFLDQALSRPGIRVVFLVVHPFLTHSHAFETVRLTPREKLAALGSQSLWQAYLEMIRIRLHRSRQTSDAFGTNFADPLRIGLNPTLRQMMRPGEDFEIDPIALDIYKEAVAELHTRQVKIVFIVPPLSENLLAQKRTAFQKYFQTFQTVMAAQDMLIDFISDQFTAFRMNSKNFADGIHLEHAAAAEVISVIDAHIAQWISQGRLPRQ